MSRTVLQASVEMLYSDRLGEPLGDWIDQSRATGASWRSIELELHARTDGALTVTAVSLAKWYGEVAA